jgi:hypothetical protein
MMLRRNCMASDPKPLTTSSSPAELAGATQQQLAALALGAKPIEGPVANASTSVVMQAGNDALLVFGRPRPLFGSDGQMANFAVTETVAMIHMSVASLKDLHWALGVNIDAYEKIHGKIVTDASLQRAAEKK